MKPDLSRLPSWPRMLTRAQAAAYCQLQPAQFEAACPVAPVSLDRRATPQARRWDRAAIDAWLDSLAGDGKAAALTRDQWLAKLDAGDDEIPARPAH